MENVSQRYIFALIREVWEYMYIALYQMWNFWTSPMLQLSATVCGTSLIFCCMVQCTELKVFVATPTVAYLVLTLLYNAHYTQSIQTSGSASYIDIHFIMFSNEDVTLFPL